MLAEGMSAAGMPVCHDEALDDLLRHTPPPPPPLLQAYAEKTYSVLLTITAMTACPAAGSVSAASLDAAPAPAPAATGAESAAPAPVARRLLRA
jgi:hypothetical protein